MAFVLLCGLVIGFTLGSLVGRYSFATEAIASGHGTYIETEAGKRIFVWKVQEPHQTPATTPK